MKFSVLKKSPKNIDRWGDYVKKNKECNIYHSYSYLKYISEYFYCELFLFCIEDNDEILGILPMHLTKAFPYGSQLVSNPFNGTYGGLCSNNKKIEEYMVKHLEAYVSDMKVRFAELREKDEADYKLPIYDIYVNYELSLFGEIDKIWEDKVKSKTRNQIRKALKSKLEWSIYKEEGIDFFYKVYEETMSRLGSPFLNKFFFQGLMNNFNNDMFISIVKYQGKPISVQWLVKSKNKVYNPWAGLVREHQALCPNNLGYWKTICWAHEAGIESFDFGRSIKGSSQEKFKKGWGGDKTKLNYHYILNNNEKIPEINPTNKGIKILSKIWKVIPISVKRMLTSFLVSRAP
jgi:FemAB-related protein (PEP-CTERM system-associated)